MNKVLATSLISHSNTHGIKLLPAEKQNHQYLIDNSSFLKDYKEVVCPIPPCSPIESILFPVSFALFVVSAVFQSELCKIIFIQNIKMSSDQPNCTLSQSKYRLKYFAVISSLQGLNEDDDSFSVYLQQCVHYNSMIISRVRVVGSRRRLGLRPDGLLRRGRRMGEGLSGLLTSGKERNMGIKIVRTKCEIVFGLEQL